MQNVVSLYLFSLIVLMMFIQILSKTKEINTWGVEVGTRIFMGNEEISK